MQGNWSGIGVAKKQRAAQKILKYLADHPEAMDTEEGIARWWLREDMNSIQAALAFLIDREILGTKMLNDRRYYLLLERYRRDRQTLLSVVLSPEKNWSPKSFRRKYDDPTQGLNCGRR